MCLNIKYTLEDIDYFVLAGGASHARRHFLGIHFIQDSWLTQTVDLVSVHCSNINLAAESQKASILDVDPPEKASRHFTRAKAVIKYRSLKYHQRRILFSKLITVVHYVTNYPVWPKIWIWTKADDHPGTVWAFTAELPGRQRQRPFPKSHACLLYTSDAADE